MATVDFGRRIVPAEATRGSWGPLDSSTITGYPTGDSEGAARGKYAQLTYIMGSEPGSLSLALSGGNVILPVSSVNINEPLSVENQVGVDFVVTQKIPDTTVYETISVPATGIATITFAPAVALIEFYNNNDEIPVYVGFNNVALDALSSQSLPLVPESFYSIERDTTNVYIGNVNTADSVDVRVIGHYKA